MIQTCVVTLDPVTTRIDQSVRRSFLPEAAERSAEIVLSPDEDDETEPLGERIDLGLVATEALALALPSYPRKPGVTFGGGAAPATSDERRQALRGARRAPRQNGQGIVRIDTEGLAEPRAIAMFRGSFSCPVRWPCA